MESRRDTAQVGVLEVGDRKVRVALQADQPLLVPHQHAWIRGAVRFVARRAAFQAHRRMFIRERASLVAMAPEAARLVAERGAHGFRAKAAVWVVAIGAGHGAFGQSMLVRTLE